MHFLCNSTATRRLALRIFNKTQVSSYWRRDSKRKKEKRIISCAKNARQCTSMESAMRYWKCIRYPVSREFAASGYAVFYGVGRTPHEMEVNREEFHFYQIEIRSLESDWWSMIFDDQCTRRPRVSSSTVYYSLCDFATCNSTMLKYRLLHERLRADISGGEVY